MKSSWPGLELLEEADESGFWLEIITEEKISTSKEVIRLPDEANQLSAILAQSSITVTERIRRKAPRQSPI